MQAKHSQATQKTGDSSSEFRNLSETTQKTEEFSSEFKEHLAACPVPTVLNIKTDMQNIKFNAICSYALKDLKYSTYRVLPYRSKKAGLFHFNW